jgi:aspartate-semialdehyde dehydrogenase
MAAPDPPRRLVVFGATGHLGQEVIEGLAESDWPIGEIVGVASPESAGAEFEIRGEIFDVVTEWPTLKGRHLVLVCTPAAVALDVVREALRAEVPCIDCSGALVGQADVPMPVRTADFDEAVAAWASAPLVSLATPTTIAWTPILEALRQAVGVRRVVATVLCSASAWGRRGIASLSDESIALFNQSEAPETGPAGQGVAFDVIPGGAIDEARVAGELARLFGPELGVALTSVQVPTFVGEGASLALELASPLDEGALESLLGGLPGVTLVAEGLGSRGPALVEEGAREIVGPTLRDSAGSGEVLVGRLRPDASLPAGLGWRLWVTIDPIGLAAAHALRLARQRLGLA